MTTKEKILFALKALFDEQLPVILRELSMEFDDGFELRDLTDTLIFGGSVRLPYAVISVKNTQYTEKDRIIESILYDVEIDFYLADCADRWRYECRYTEAVKRLVELHRRHVTAWEWRVAAD